MKRRVAIKRQVNGFTLIEVLLATSLLAAGLALAFATLRAATVTVGRGDAIAQRSERMRAVEGFLRSRLTGVRPVPFGMDDESGLPLRFTGDGDTMHFVSDLPDYLGRGGPYLHTLAIQRDGGQLRLTVDLTLVQGGEAMPAAQPRPPELLVGGLRTVRFRYRTLDADGQLGQWQAQWDTPDALPLQVEIELQDADGRVWPPLVVAPPLAAGFTSRRGQ